MAHPSTRPDDFPEYGTPWLLVEIIEGFTQKLRYEPIDIPWADLHVAVLQIGSDVDNPAIELEFTYDGIRKLSVNHWGWIESKLRIENDEWGLRNSVEYDLLESEDVENLNRFLKETIEDHNVKLQYPSCTKSES